MKLFFKKWWHNLTGPCSCPDVAGEDPACPVHGRVGATVRLLTEMLVMTVAFGLAGLVWQISEWVKR